MAIYNPDIYQQLSRHIIIDNNTPTTFAYNGDPNNARTFSNSDVSFVGNLFSVEAIKKSIDEINERNDKLIGEHITSINKIKINTIINNIKTQLNKQLRASDSATINKPNDVEFLEFKKICEDIISEAICIKLQLSFCLKKQTCVFKKI